MPRGRPSKLTLEIQEKLCELLRAGAFRRHAAAHVGLSENTIGEWYHRGAREDRGAFRAFHLAVDLAEATFAKTGLEMLQAMGARDPKVIQWLLSRRFPELYGRKDNVEDKSPEDRAAQAQATRTLLLERLERLFPEPEPEKAEPPALPEGAPDALT